MMLLSRAVTTLTAACLLAPPSVTALESAGWVSSASSGAEIISAAAITCTYRLPVEGAVTSAVMRYFDPPARNWLTGHRGVDLAACEGCEVLAPGAGVVSNSGVVGGKPYL
ncbi:MAG: M23 family metallopeptidase, partial [Cellulomonadaceae bacterium]|nr:M23 family metallopeptidase [Cellulomonadaceae bacterium]